MAAAGLMVGCTNFSDFQNTVELDVQGNYESAFVQRFGQPAETQDWGFSDRVASTRATEAEWTQYAKSADYYLDGLTEAEMQQYNAFTDEDINSQGHIFGTSTMGNTRAATRAVGDAIDGNSYFRVSVGFNPTDGQDAYMYNGSNVVGILTFGGTGNAAESSATFSDYPAKIVRPYIIFKPLVDNQWGAITTYYESRGNSAKLIIYDMTDNKYIRGGGEWDFTYENAPYNGSIAGGHSYKIYFSDNEPISFYGIQYYVQGKVLEFVEPNDNTGDNTDDNTGDNTGDNQGNTEEPAAITSKFYRVASGTEITKQFSITTGSMNGSVIYVQGKLNIGTGYTLNGVTIVVADGGEVHINGTQNLSTNGRFIVLPGGRITGTDGAYLAVTNGSKCYNAGTISYAGELNTNGSDFYNCGSINVSKLRNTTSQGSSKITNFGTIVAGCNEGAADTYNCEFINGCYWQYTGDAGIAKLTMLNNSRLDVGGKALFSGQQTLYENSMINCQDIQCQQATFNGPTTDGSFAIVRISRDVWIGYGGDITASGNVYFDWGKKDQGLYVNSTWSDLDNQWSAFHGIKQNMSKFANEAGRELFIPEGECTGAGYSNNGGSSQNDTSEETNTSDNTSDNTQTPDITQPEEHQTSSTTPAAGNPTNAVCRIIVEDLTVSQSSDFDFNDVVFDVCPNDDGATTTLIIRAVGGELPLYIEGQEVHQAIWGEICAKMMNTGRDGAIDFDKECGRITIGKYVASRAAAKDIVVEVTKMSTNIPLKSDAGKVASKIAVGTDYEWCGETQDIDRKYNVDGVKLFQQYVIGNYANDVWYRVLYESR